MSTATRRRERMLESIERITISAQASGLSRARIEDHQLEGHIVTIDGQRLINFGSCAYLGLNVDPRLKAGAIDAIERYGPVFSSSTAYTSVPLFTELEVRLSAIFDAAVIVPATTTLAHLGALPVLVGPDDAVVVDAQAHSSVHLGAQVLVAQGTELHIEPHRAYDALEERIAELANRCKSVWFLADGVYSMLGDVMPIDWVNAMLDRYPNLRVYIDDAHGMGWQGIHGRGHVLNEHPLHPRVVVAMSLGKSFGSGGAALVFADPEEAQRVQLCAGTMMFSGPLHPAELGAAVASADIHLSDEHGGMQATVYEQIALMRRLSQVYEVPLENEDESPIWFVRAGSFRGAMELGRRMIKDGFYLNLAAFPAVAHQNSGLRFTHTRYHDDSHLDAMMRSLGENLRIVSRGGDEVDLANLD